MDRKDNPKLWKEIGMAPAEGQMVPTDLPGHFDLPGSRG